jgi:hypothetical protein
LITDLITAVTWYICFGLFGWLIKLFVCLY